MRAAVLDGHPPRAPRSFRGPAWYENAWYLLEDDKLDFSKNAAYPFLMHKYVIRVSEKFEKDFLQGHRKQKEERGWSGIQT